MHTPWAILLAINDLDTHGGASALLCTLARQLRSCGHEVAVFTRYPIDDRNQYARHLREGGISLNPDCVSRLRAPAPADGRRPLYRWLSRTTMGRAARRALRAHAIAARAAARPALIQVHRGATWLAWSSGLGVPIVYLENGVPVRDPSVAWWWTGIASGLRRVSMVVASSQRAAAGVRDVLKYAGRIEVLPWIVEVPASVDRTSTGPRMVIGAAGRLSAEKGHSILIQAVAEIRRSLSDVRLLLAGDGPERRALEAQVAGLGLEGAVEFLGALDERGMETFWSAIEVLALPSHHEGVPLIAIEGMARGVPVVATDVGGVAELLDGGRYGRLVPARDPAALAGALSELLSNSDTRQCLAAAARRHYVEQHAPAGALPRWLAVYEHLLNSRPPDAGRGQGG